MANDHVSVYFVFRQSRGPTKGALPTMPAATLGALITDREHPNTLDRDVTGFQL